MVDGRFAKLALVASAVLLSACTPSQTRPAVGQVHPRSGNEARQTMTNALAKGDRAALTGGALDLARMGGTLTDATLKRIATSLDPEIVARGAPGWFRPGEAPADMLRRWFAQNGQGSAQPPLFAEVPAEYRLVEGVAWDAKTRRLFVGTVVEGRLAYRDAQGGWHEVALGSPSAGLFGMAIDEKRRTLWIVTSRSQVTARSGEWMRGLIAVDLDTLKVVHRVTGAIGQLGDLTVAPDGTVVATELVGGIVYRCRPGCATLEEFMPAASFSNPQGLTFSADGKRLYIADYRTGLWRVDPRTGSKQQLGIAEPTMLDGIDGLLMHDGQLIAIQNGTRPRRIMRFTLDRSGTQIVAARKWIVISPEAGEPTLGAIRGDELLFVADSQWERYGDGGALTDGKPVRPTPILATSLSELAR